ncbi:hypothetical protein B0H14DRAFT_2596816 [Mycena olivaceomarginata]|nr:hypothetical protein B0H14DRAFT_2596816 [Mycena olivaceomarginata]
MASKTKIEAKTRFDARRWDGPGGIWLLSVATLLSPEGTGVRTQGHESNRVRAWFYGGCRVAWTIATFAEGLFLPRRKGTRTRPPHVQGRLKRLQHGEGATSVEASGGLHEEAPGIVNLRANHREARIRDLPGQYCAMRSKRCYNYQDSETESRVRCFFWVAAETGE